MENYGLSKFDWLREFLALPSGIPCADTFRRVFERINPQVFERCFQRWVQSIVKTIGAQVIPIDGKTQARFLRQRAAEISVAFG